MGAAGLTSSTHVQAHLYVRAMPGGICCMSQSLRRSSGSKPTFDSYSCRIVKKSMRFRSSYPDTRPQWQQRKEPCVNLEAIWLFTCGAAGAVGSGAGGVRYLRCLV